jgi:hypothetical protein
LDELGRGRMHAKPEKELFQLLVGDWNTRVIAEGTRMQGSQHLSLQLLTVPQPDMTFVTYNTILEAVMGQGIWVNS